MTTHETIKEQLENATGRRYSLVRHCPGDNACRYRIVERNSPPYPAYGLRHEGLVFPSFHESDGVCGTVVGLAQAKTMVKAFIVGFLTEKDAA